MELKTDLKASNLFFNHEIVLRLDSFAKEIGILVVPLEQYEPQSLYFRTEDFPRFIKYLILFWVHVLEHKKASKYAINAELQEIIDFCTKNMRG
ncbi:MAG: hypothetical protein DRJ03_08090 [Chloroflexi bacterium]|nr:MAG: hypothetical protein DRJ03_08090 [Chloroflexota bacterium]